MLKIHYLCGDKDNWKLSPRQRTRVVICSKFITFAVTKTTRCTISITTCVLWFAQNSLPLRWQRQQKLLNYLQENSCDLLKIHYLCGDKDNRMSRIILEDMLWFAQNSLPLRWQRQLLFRVVKMVCRCDLLKIHYLCGDKDNALNYYTDAQNVVICSKFITFAVTKTTWKQHLTTSWMLWFAQNSLPLRWQRQHSSRATMAAIVVICSKFITFAVTKTTLM